MAALKHCLVFLLSLFALQSTCLTIGGRPNQLIKPYKRAPLQDLVTWDEYSLFVRGERILFYSGEFHPFRLPVPDLWFDVFQKIKALGYSGVSFYVDWALVEGKQGDFSAKGVFALEPFFEAASEAGIYLLARPGPYINAEVSGGGFPGWLQRFKGKLRTPDYLNTTANYVQNIGSIIATAQITNGGPLILLQPENEYTNGAPGTIFPNGDYFAAVEDMYRDAGIVVPFISNDASPKGIFAPGNGTGSVDLYGFDAYPLGFDCANPYTWPTGALPTTFHTLHLEQSPTTATSLVEFQGGSFDPWGGLGFAQCSVLLNNEFERVFYKNDFSFGVTIINFYMTYGGSNWGNLGHPGGYSSYDYGAVITEERQIWREKYSEAKFYPNFLKVSPEYLTSTPGNVANGSFTGNANIAVTPLVGKTTSFYVVRHAAYQSPDSTTYKLTVPTNTGNITIPQLGGSLTLNGRDSKIHVVGYDIGGSTVQYSSAEIFTWQHDGNKTVLILYGGANETHEAAFSGISSAKLLEGDSVTMQTVNGAIVLNWSVTPARTVVQVGDSIVVYLLWRNDAYNHFVLELPAASPTNNFTSTTKSSVVAKAGYLLRTVAIEGTTLAFTGDVNATTTLEVLAGAPEGVSTITFNGQSLTISTNDVGNPQATISFSAPNVPLPDLQGLNWKYLDGLPEVQPTYDDSAWTAATLSTTNNPRNLTTPTSLYASDYGFNTGSLLYRGHLTSSGNESTFFVETQGGSAFGASFWLNNTYLGSWPGIGKDSNYNQTLTLPNLSSGNNYVLTVLIDHMGFDENGQVGADEMKDPRGILSYNLAGRDQSAISWKLTGNLGGETYQDRTRGPLNEGGMYPERQGYHLPNPPSGNWSTAKPTDGITSAGVGFYTTSFDLDFPEGYDIPLSFVFTNATGNVSDYRCQLFVNGYQFGKYVNNIGPQTSFPVPEGILNHHGTNYIALSLWALEATGAKVAGLELEAGPAILSGYRVPALSPQPAWQLRPGAY